MEPFSMHAHPYPFGLSLSKPGHEPMTTFDKPRLNGSVEDFPPTARLNLPWPCAALRQAQRERMVVRKRQEAAKSPAPAA